MSTNLEQSSTAVHHAPPRVRAVTAWELIAITLRYYRKLILLGYGVISVVGALILAIVVLVEGREIRVVFLLATALFLCGSMLLEDVSPRLMIELGHQGISQHHLAVQRTFIVLDEHAIGNQSVPCWFDHTHHDPDALPAVDALRKDLVNLDV